jgi:hypothetical protein
MGNEKFLAAIQQAVSEVPFFYDLDCPGIRECESKVARTTGLRR